jgi:hypothetical protein
MVQVPKNAAETVPNAPIDVEERRALVERMAASPQFKRSTRLRDFLLYVGLQSLKEGVTEIHEQEVGANVFGRLPAYDTSQDNIVRVNATELRRRIEAYFTAEGAQEEIVLAIPRGAYKPVFHRRIPELVQAPDPLHINLEQQILALVEPPAAPAPPQPAGFRPHLIWASITLSLVIACAVLWQQNRILRRPLVSWDQQPAVAALWSEFTHPGQETDIVLPDASVSISEEILGRAMSLSAYLDHDYMHRIQSSNLSPERAADLTSVFSHNLVTLGDFHAAQQILNLTPLAPSLHLTLARFYLAESIKRNSVVLIGGKKANPWVRLFDDQMNFSLDFDNAHKQSLINNRHPQPGEQTIYEADMDTNGFIGYCVIAYLPNPSHTGNVLILAGTDSDATGAAAEFVTSQDHLAGFLRTLHARRFPYFELLLKTSRLSGTSFNAEAIAYRTYPGIR